MTAGAPQGALPDRVLVTSRARSAGYFAGSMVFTLSSVPLKVGPWDGLLANWFWSCVSLACALQVVFPYRLELDAEGFTNKAFWKKSRTLWVDCGEFRVVRRFGAVVFEDRGYRPHRWLRAFNRWYLGGDFVVGAGRYGGFTSQDLAHLMNTYRAAAPAAPASPAAPAAPPPPVAHTPWYDPGPEEDGLDR